MLKLAKSFLKFSFLFLFFITFNNIPSFSNNNFQSVASLNGFIKDSANGETLIGASVFIKDIKAGAYTNKNGYYNLKNIPAGTYEVIFSFLGYEKKMMKLKFNESENKRLDLELSQASSTTEEISVYADRSDDKKQISISKVNIPIQQIKEIRIGGESDIFRSLQLLPGILTSSQISSGLFVRGGSPDQNLVLLDGSAVYNPSHLFGFISTFNTDAIKDVELIKGGFPAEYGGRLSAVLNITQKDGNKEKVEGIANVGVISSKLAVEGPLGDGSFFFGARRTYFELIKSFVEEDPTAPLPDFNFYDLNGKITQNLGKDDKISLSGFKSQDNLLFESFGVGLDMEVGNELGALRWTHLFSESLFLTSNLSVSNYSTKFSGDNSGYKFIINNSILDYTGKMNLEWFYNNDITFKFGGEITNLQFNYLQNFSGDTDSTADGSQAGSTKLKVADWNYTAFAQGNIQIDPFTSMQLGLRGSYWELADKNTFDPRLAIRWQPDEDFAIKGAVGVYHQILKLATQPDFSFLDTWLTTDSTVNISRANHYIISFETKPTEGYDLNFDFYYKELFEVNELNRLALQGEQVKDFFYEGSAKSYGAEVFLQKRIGKFTGWAGYALGYIYAQFDSVNNGIEFRPKYDRRHDFKIVAQYKASDDWEYGANFTFQSGQSFTGASSRFQSRLPGDNDGRGKIIPSQRWGLRLPNSHQLNVNVSHYFSLAGLKSRVILDIYNIYNRRDIWFRYYDTDEEKTTPTDVRLLPILPTLSIEVKF